VIDDDMRYEHWTRRPGPFGCLLSGKWTADYALCQMEHTTCLQDLIYPRHHIERDTCCWHCLQAILAAMGGDFGGGKI